MGKGAKNDGLAQGYNLKGGKQGGAVEEAKDGAAVNGREVAKEGLEDV